MRPPKTPDNVKSQSKQPTSGGRQNLLQTTSTGDKAGDAPDSLVRQEEAALILQVTPRCLENWRYRGGGPRWVQISSRCIRYRRSDLALFIEERVKSNTTKCE